MRLTLLSVSVLVLAMTVRPAVAVAGEAPLQVEEQEMTRYWVPKQGEFRPRLSSDPGRQQFATEVVVAYTVTKRGRTRDVEVLRATPAGAYSGWAADAIRASRFNPAEGNTQRRSVRTTSTATFALPTGK